eukprot:PITA_35197
MVDPVKIAVILILEALRSVKQLCTTLGHTRYYRKFIKIYAQITMPMEKLLKRDVMFCWNDDCMKSLDVLKEKLASTPILVFLKWDVEFHVHVDASCIVLGVVLTQEGGEGLDHLIEFASHRLSKAEKNSSTTKFVVSLGWLNVGPDHLSRIETGEEPTNLEEGLPDTDFVVHVASRHFEYIIHFLTTRTTPKEYSIQQKKKLIVHGANFSVIVGHLYKMGNDEILQRYLPEFEQSQILGEAHGGTIGGHYAGRATM